MSKHCCHEWTLPFKNLQPWICGCNDEFFGSIDAKYECKRCHKLKVISYHIDV